MVQVIDPAGRVRGGSPDAGTSPLLGPAQIRQARQHSFVLTRRDEDERERVMAGPLARHPGWVAVASVDLEAFDRTRRDVTRELLIAGVVFVAAAGLGGYGLARAALSPVERLRREVASVSARDPAPGLQVPRTRDEIAALATTMNELLGRLQGALARQRALVADASHELRTPFAVLRGELELAARPGRSREELAAAVEQAGEEAARLARITEQLLFLARSDEDRIQPRLERTAIGPLLTRSAEHAAARARAAGVSVVVDVPAGLVAEVDPDRIREATDNLVDNALRFAPAGNAGRGRGPGGRSWPGHRGPRPGPRLPRGVPAPRVRAVRTAGHRTRPQRRRRGPGPGDRERDRAGSRGPGSGPQPAWRRRRGHARAPRARRLRVIAERQVALVFLGGVQPEDGMEPVEQAVQVGEVRLVGRARADVVEKLAETPDLVGDLGVSAAHRGGDVAAAEQPVQGRVQFMFLGLLVRPDLLGQQLVRVADLVHRFGWRGGSRVRPRPCATSRCWP